MIVYSKYLHCLASVPPVRSTQFVAVPSIKLHFLSLPDVQASKCFYISYRRRRQCSMKQTITAHRVLILTWSDHFTPLYSSTPQMWLKFVWPNATSNFVLRAQLTQYGVFCSCCMCILSSFAAQWLTSWHMKSPPWQKIPWYLFKDTCTISLHDAIGVGMPKFKFILKAILYAKYLQSMTSLNWYGCRFQIEMLFSVVVWRTSLAECRLSCTKMSICFKWWQSSNACWKTGEYSL